MCPDARGTKPAAWSRPRTAKRRRVGWSSAAETVPRPIVCGAWPHAPHIEFAGRIGAGSQHRPVGAACKAVIPAAGLATRFLPATKAVPKELLPVVDRPVLQYIVEEAARAGIHDVLLVTGRGKTSMVDHFDRRPDLEARLEAKGDLERLDEIQRITELAEIYTCRQGEPLGLGHAVSYAESHVGGESFAVLLGDEFTDEDDPLLPAMLDLQAADRRHRARLHRGAGRPDQPLRHRVGRARPTTDRRGRG